MGLEILNKKRELSYLYKVFFSLKIAHNLTKVNNSLINSARLQLEHTVYLQS